MKPSPFPKQTGDEGEQLTFFDLDSDRDLLPADISEASAAAGERKVDVNFFNDFEDDFDEGDMAL